MQPVRLLIEQACEQAPGSLDPALCTLQHGKTKLAADEPIRFANLPRNVTLTLQTSTRLPTPATQLAFVERGRPQCIHVPTQPGTRVMFAPKALKDTTRFSAGQLDAPRLGFAEPLAKAPQGPLRPIAEAPATTPQASISAKIDGDCATGSAVTHDVQAGPAGSSEADAATSTGQGHVAQQVPAPARDSGRGGVAQDSSASQAAGGSGQEGQDRSAIAADPAHGGASTSRAASSSASHGLGKPRLPSAEELMARAQQRCSAYPLRKVGCCACMLVRAWPDLPLRCTEHVRDVAFASDGIGSERNCTTQGVCGLWRARPGGGHAGAQRSGGRSAGRR